MRRKQRKQERTDIRLRALEAKNEFLGFNPIAVAKTIRYFVRDAATLGTMPDAAATTKWIGTCTEDVGNVCRPARAGGIAVACGTKPEAARWACKAARVCGVSSTAVAHPSGLHEVEVHAGPGTGASSTWRSIAVGVDGTLLPPLNTTLQRMVGAALRDLAYLRKSAQPADEVAACDGTAGAVAPVSGSGPRAHRQRRGSRQKSSRQAGSGPKQSGQKSGGRGRRGDVATQAAEQPVAFVRGGILNDASSSRQMVEVEEAAGARGGGDWSRGAEAGAGAGGAVNAGVSCSGCPTSPSAPALAEDAVVALPGTGHDAAMDGVILSAKASLPGAAAADTVMAEAAEPAVLVGLQPGLGATVGDGDRAYGPGRPANEGPQALRLGVVEDDVDTETAAAGGAAMSGADAVPVFDLEFGGFVLTAGAESAAGSVRTEVPPVSLLIGCSVLAVLACGVLSIAWCRQAGRANDVGPVAPVMVVDTLAGACRV